MLLVPMWRQLHLGMGVNATFNFAVGVILKSLMLVNLFPDGCVLRGLWHILRETTLRGLTKTLSHWLSVGLKEVLHCGPPSWRTWSSWRYICRSKANQIFIYFDFTSKIITLLKALPVALQSWSKAVGAILCSWREQSAELWLETALCVSYSSFIHKQRGPCSSLFRVGRFFTLEIRVPDGRIIRRGNCQHIFPEYFTRKFEIAWKEPLHLKLKWTFIRRKNIWGASDLIKQRTLDPIVHTRCLQFWYWTVTLCRHM